MDAPARPDRNRSHRRGRADLAAAIAFGAAALFIVANSPTRVGLRLGLEVRSSVEGRLSLHVDAGDGLQTARVDAGGWRSVSFFLPRATFHDLRLKMGDEGAPIEIRALRVGGPFGLPDYRLDARLVRKLFHLREQRHNPLYADAHWIVPDAAFYRAVDALRESKSFFLVLAVLAALAFWGLIRSLDWRLSAIRSLAPAFLRGAGIFLAAVTVPLVVLIIHPSRIGATAERRAADRPPAFRADAPLEFPLRFGPYFSRHFPFRTTLIGLYNLLEIEALGYSPVNLVLVGKDGWWYLDRPVDEPGTTEYFQAYKLFSEGELDEWARVLEGRRAWLAGRGIRYMFVIAPDKVSIYPEFMPDRIRQFRHVSRMDQLLDYLGKHTNIAAPDLRPALLAAKKSRQVYPKKDSHWNDMGAFIADGEIQKSLAAFFPSAAPLALSDFELKTVPERKEDMFDWLELTRLPISDPVLRLEPRRPWGWRFTYQADRFFITERPAAPLGPLVIIHDSFYAKLYPFLSEHFSRVSYIRDNDKSFNEKYIEADRPVLVIDEMAERYLLRRPSGMR